MRSPIPERVINPAAFALISGGSAEATLLTPVVPAQRMALWPGLRHALSAAGGEFFEMGRYLVIGSLLAALLQTVIPQEALSKLASNPVNSVLVMAALAFVLSLCSTVDAFIARSFAQTFTVGSLLTFLTFGPMVDIKTLSMYLGTFRRRTVLYLVLLPLLISTLFGLWLNLNVRF